MTTIDTGLPGLALEVVKDGSNVQPTPAERVALADLCHGLDVLDIGTGTGASARAMASTARSVLTVENDPEWQGKADLPDGVTEFYGDWREVEGGFDLVFIDHFPISDRIDAVAAFLSRGCQVVLHDSNIIANAVPNFSYMLDTAALVHEDHHMYLIGGVPA